jgi:hypothetical protein
MANNDKVSVFENSYGHQYVYGIAFKSKSDFIDKIIEKKTTIINEPLVKHPSCKHYLSIDDMKTRFCPDCGTKNTTITKGGQRVLYSYEYKPFIDSKNNMNKIELYKDILVNKFAFESFARYTIGLIEDKGGYIFMNGFRYIIYANAAGDTSSEIYVAVEFDQHIGKSLLEYLVKKDDDLLKKEGFEDVIVVKNLQNIFGVNVTRHHVDI